MRSQTCNILKLCVKDISSMLGKDRTWKPVDTVIKNTFVTIEWNLSLLIVGERSSGND